MAEELRLGDLPGLTPEQKAGLERGIAGIEQRAADKAVATLNPKLMTEDGVRSVVQTALSAQLEALRPSASQRDKELEMEFKGHWLRTLIGSESSRIAAQAEVIKPQYRDFLFDKRTTIASITSGSTTYSNVTPAVTFNDIYAYASTICWHREKCRVIPTTMRTGTFPVAASTRVTAYRRTQGDDHTASTPTMSGHTFTMLPLSASVIITNELLDWGVPVLYQWVVEEVGYGIAIKEFTEFQTGSDSSQWDGIETDITSTYQVTGTTSDEMDLIKKLYWSYPQEWRPRATFWAEGTTIAAIESLQNAAGYKYFPLPGPLDRLCGLPLLECGVATAGKLWMGDLSKYHIYSGTQQSGTTMEGKNLASSNSTMLYFHTYNDAGPADSNAFRYCEITVA